MTDEKYKNFIKTSDFDLSSTLYALGFNISGIDKSNPHRVIFYFERTSDIEVSINNYFNHKLSLDPFVLNHSRTEIMAQIHTDR